MDATDNELNRLREDLARTRQQLIDSQQQQRAMEQSYKQQIADVEEASSAALAAAIASAAAASKTPLATTPTTPLPNNAQPRFQIHAAAVIPAGKGTNSLDNINGKTAISSPDHGLGPAAPPPMATSASAPIVIDRTLGSELRILREALADVQEVCIISYHIISYHMMMYLSYLLS
jgi:hypothetical protein